MTQRHLIAEVRAYALKHYRDGGWDVIVEAWDDQQIAEAISGATTLTGAIRKLSPIVEVWADRQADADFHRGGDDYYRKRRHHPDARKARAARRRSR